MGRSRADRGLQLMKYAVRRVRPRVWPLVRLSPKSLLTPNRADVALRVECLRKVINEGVPVEETLYYQYAGDQDRGRVANPDAEVARLLARASQEPFAGDGVVVFQNSGGDHEYQLDRGEDAVAAAIFRGYPTIQGRLLPYNAKRKPDDHSALIERKRDFYERCCTDADLRATLRRIREIFYGALLTGDATTKRVGFTARAEASDEARNFRSGARVVEATRNFYQGLQRIGIEGERPSEIRFAEYGLESLLTGNESVLDLGCNTGFFSAHVANYVRQVRGIEANADLVAIGKIVHTHLGVRNCEIERTPYEELGRDERYDLILACNFHYYLSISPPEFLEQVLGMLNPGGHVLLETVTRIKPGFVSGDLSELNNLAIPVVEELLDEGRIRIRRQGISASNTKWIRKYTIVQKM